MIWVNRLGLGPCLWIGVHVLVFLCQMPRLGIKVPFSKWISRRYNSSTTPRTATKGCWSDEMLRGTWFEYRDER